MKSKSHAGFWLSAWFAGLFGLVAHTAHGQPLYTISKAQSFIQRSSAEVIATGFAYAVQVSSNATLTLPGGSIIAVPVGSNNGSQAIDQIFSTKAALDAAYPSGTHQITGVGIPTLSFNFSTDLYPTVTPQITNGTWNSGGLFVVDPAQTATINFNTFTGYTTSGVAGHIQVEIRPLSGPGTINLNNSEVFSQPILGNPAQPTPITSITIPAGTLTNGQIYEGRIDYQTASTLDTTSVAGGLAAAIFDKSLSFYVSAVSAGSATLPAPTITSQPTNQTGALGGSVTFSATINYNQSQGQFVNGGYFWRLNGQSINPDGIKYVFNSSNGGTVDSLTINNLTAADAGNYSLQAWDSGGILFSTDATLTVAAASAPAITQQPSAKTVNLGSTVVFAVGASATPAPTYKWRKDGVDIPGGTGATLVVQGTTLASAGNYSVVVANSAGSVTSSPAALTVTSVNDRGRLTNLSVLTNITAAVPSFTVGTVVGGNGVSGTQALVVRAVGPSLGALSVPGTIGDPKLDLFNGQTVVDTNDNWGGGSALANAMASVGAFAYTGPTSLDAAVYQPSLNTGGYTVVASGVNGSTGTAIAEIYDATPPGTYTPTTPRLINVSVLKPIDSGSSLTLGFTVSGSTAETVLIRVIGPGLARVGLTSGTLGDPQLTLFNGQSAVIATNDDWGADPQLYAAGERVGAFSIGNTQTKDAMLITTLPAGGYTARASGGGGTGGYAIVEVYEVP